MQMPATDDLSGILLDQVDRLFQQHVDRKVLGAADGGAWAGAAWQAVEEAGLPTALVPEAAGGTGLAVGDALLLVRRAGYHTVPLPLAETIVANALWAAAAGETPAGPLTLAPARPDDRVSLRRDGDGVVLAGTARRVPWGAQAAHILVFARDEDGQGHLGLVPRGSAATEAVRNIAGEPRETVCFDGVRLPADAVRPAPAALGSHGLILHGALVRIAQMTGAMARCLDYALAYANERVQFGRPIAKFQAIQHMLAIAAGQHAAATAVADALPEAYDTPDFGFAVAVAKARCGEAAGQVAAACHQVHGAMGFTQEHPLHFATRRLWSWRDEFGAEAFWQERIGEAVCGTGGEALWPLLVGETHVDIAPLAL